MVWRNPLPLKLILTDDTDSFRTMPPGCTGLPLPPHPGAFGVARKYHVHEGVDLYAPDGTPVTAVEAGVVVAVLPFTGAIAGLPWWLDTWAVLVEGASGVVVYGEVSPAITVGAHVLPGHFLGRVTRVLRHDKGRPVSMLHLELHPVGSRSCPEWHDATSRPVELLDPTPRLVECAQTETPKLVYDAPWPGTVSA